MRDLVVSTYTGLGRQQLPRLLETLAEAGHERVEILATPPHVDLENVDAAIETLIPVIHRTGQRVTSVVPSGVDVNLASTHAGMRRWSVGQFLATVRLAAGLGAEHVIVHPGRRHPLRPPPPEQLVEWVLDGLDTITHEAKAGGTSALLENVPTGLIDTAEECAALVAQLPGRLGLCYDVANGYMVEDVPQALDDLAIQPDLVHISDTKRDRWLHDPLGTAEVPWPEVAAALARRSYGGRIVLETLHDQDPVTGFARDAAVWTTAIDRAC